MRLAAFAMLLAVAAAPAAAGSPAPADEAEARRLLEAAAAALDRLPAVALELRREGESLSLLRQPGVGLLATTAQDGVLVLGDASWDRDAAEAPWTPGRLPAAELRAFVAQMDAAGAPLTGDGLRALIARSGTVVRVPPSEAPAFAAPAPADVPGRPCTVTAIALDGPAGTDPAQAPVELQLCAEDARLLSGTVRVWEKDGSVRIEHARYLDAGERRLTRP